MLKQTTVAAATLALAAASVSAQLSTQTTASGLAQPLFVTQPVGDGRLFAVERGGTVGALSGGSGAATPFLTVNNVTTAGEGGLLGLAFAPDYATSGELYVNYTTPSSTPAGFDTVIGRVRVENPADESIGSVTPDVILRFPQPFGNHNAGWIGFRPGDATGQFLYVPTGDGGSGNDPGNRAQDLTGLYGKVLRLDVSGGDDFASDPNRNYVVPSTNFYAADGNAATLGEIVSYGLRNPYRNSFDRDTGDFYIGDVGQNTREEIDRLSIPNTGTVGGQNFGWRIREGFEDNPGTGGTLLSANRTDPIFDFGHDSGPVDGRSVTGGYVYRGDLLGADYEGLYFFGDFIAGNIYTLDPSSTDPEKMVEDVTSLLFSSPLTGRLVSFGEDADGELYVVDIAGNVFAIVPEPSSLALLGAGALALFAADVGREPSPEGSREA